MKQILETFKVLVGHNPGNLRLLLAFTKNFAILIIITVAATIFLAAASLVVQFLVMFFDATWHNQE
jgi:hypothetical protein